MRANITAADDRGRTYVDFNFSVGLLDSVRYREAERITTESLRARSRLLLVVFAEVLVADLACDDVLRARPRERRRSVWTQNNLPTSKLRMLASRLLND